MTYEEAIEMLKVTEEITLESSDLAKACRFGINALEKQIPKKPTVDKEGYKYCPSCLIDCGNCEVLQLVGNRERKMFDFCPNCGQAIDWSDNNESNTND